MIRALAFTTSVDDDVDVQRMNDVLAKGADGAKTLRLTGAWTSVGLGSAEIVAGGILLGTVSDPLVNPTIPIELFIAGGLTLGISLPSFLIRSPMEQLAKRSRRELADTAVPAKERVERALVGLHGAADAEDSQRVLQIVAGSFGLALAVGGEIFVQAFNGLTPDYRAGFGTALAVLGALDLAVLIDVIVSRPAHHALDEWEQGGPKAAVNVMPVVGPGGVGLVGTF